MTKTEQVEFVKALAESVTASIVKQIEAGKIPENWDGIELRQLLADRFTASVFTKTMSRSRKAAYNNTVLVNDL